MPALQDMSKEFGSIPRALTDEIFAAVIHRARLTRLQLQSAASGQGAVVPDRLAVRRRRPPPRSAPARRVTRGLRRRAMPRSRAAS